MEKRKTMCMVGVLHQTLNFENKKTHLKFLRLKHNNPKFLVPSHMKKKPIDTTWTQAALIQLSG